MIDFSGHFHKLQTVIYGMLVIKIISNGIGHHKPLWSLVKAQTKNINQI